ncbi:MAG TPA: TetR/AcrR family transcriptional regulator [Pedomonas sp.]|uniref:TetR/AcrR family transcriptional regulator n=1 Tax=Pedomonas sp. TaxID=2976421 RepID=UPI002F3EEB5C
MAMRSADAPTLPPQTVRADRQASRSTREDILREAERIFAEVGFAGASLDDIAKAVGIRRPSVLHHFPSKREIYDTVEAQFYEDLRRHSLGRKVEGAAMDQLKALLRGWLDFMVNRPTVARLILRNSSDHVSRTAEPVKFSDAIIREFEAIIEAGQRDGQFAAVEPMLAMHLLTTPILMYVSTSRLLGEKRIYDPSDPDRLAQFWSMLERSAEAVLRPHL